MPLPFSWRAEAALDDAPKLLVQLGLSSEPDLDVIGRGFHGVVFALSGDRVLKVTLDPADAVISARLQGRRIRGVLRIFDVFRLKQGMYGIVEERAIPAKSVTAKKVSARESAAFRAVKKGLNKSLDEYIAQHGVASMFGEGLALETAWELQPEILDRAEEVAVASLHRSSKSDTRHVGLAEQYFDDLQNAVRAVERAGGRLPDVTPENIGLVKRRGRWQAVVLDLGSSLPEREAKREVKKIPFAR